MRKAQAATEFLVLFMILMIALTSATFMTVERSRDLTDIKISLEVTKLLNDASNKINMAFLEGPGFMINLTLPEQVFSLNYTIYIQSNYMSVEIQNTTHFKSLLTDNTTGTLKKGVNLVQNKNGVVVIS